MEITRPLVCLVRQRKNQVGLQKAPRDQGLLGFFRQQQVQNQGLLGIWAFVFPKNRRVGGWAHQQKDLH